MWRGNLFLYPNINNHSRCEIPVPNWAAIRINGNDQLSGVCVCLSRERERAQKKNDWRTGEYLRQIIAVETFRSLNHTIFIDSEIVQCTQFTSHAFLWLFIIEVRATRMAHTRQEPVDAWIAEKRRARTYTFQPCIFRWAKFYLEIMEMGPLECDLCGVT